MTEAVHNLSVALSRLGHSVSILTTSFKLPHADDVPTDIPVVRIGRAVMIPGNKSYATLPVGRKLPFQVRNFLGGRCFDVIHLHGFYPPEIGFWALHYSRSVNVVTINTFSERPLPVPASLVGGLFRRHLGRIHGRIAISEACRRGMARYLPGDYRVIPHGVDVDAFSPDTPALADLTGDGCPVLLFLGRLDERKGLEVLLDAMPAIIRGLGRVKLVVVGAGPKRDAVSVRARELGIQGSVVFKGFVPKQYLPRYYASCDVYISPALSGEAQGIVLLEAMASGKPVIASNIAGYNETVNDGETGILFPAGDADALGRAVIALLKDTALGKKLAANGRRAAIAQSWPAVANRIAHYYCELLAIHGRPVKDARPASVTG